MKRHLLLLSFFLLMSCQKKVGVEKKTIWIYTSLYKEVLPNFDPYFRKLFPDFNIQWYQAGSEDISAKIQAELKGAKTQASILLTSDVFFYLEMSEKGKLLSLEGEALKKLDPLLVNPEKNIAVVRYPVMVMAFNPKFVKEKEAPLSVAGMLDPKFKGKITMPSPLQSGTALTTLFFLERKFGKSLNTKLKNNDVLAAGGNGATLGRILSGEKPLGLLLMENVLQSHEKGQEDIVYQIPQEGAMPIPSPIAVFKDSDHPNEAKALAEWFMGEEAQNIIRKAWLYSPLPQIAAPNGAPEYSKLKKMDWTWAQLKEWKEQREDLKNRFQKTVLR